MNKYCKICIMGIYIGKLPDYFDIWLKSCENNSTIDFAIISDQKIENIPSNVKVINMELHEIKDTISKKMGFDVKLETPFKLCDYKPAYGYIFDNIFKGYDYWGHCDFDLIWGDLRFFFEKYKLEEYDKFLPMGHLSLYKNTLDNNIKFMSEIAGYSNYKTIFSSEKNYLFDELALIKIFEQNDNKYFDQIIYADVNPLLSRYTLCTELKYYSKIYEDFRKKYKPANVRNQVFMWEDKKIYQYYYINNSIERREYIYIHIQKRKWKLEGEFSAKMIISNNKVFSSNDKDMRLIINKYNKYCFIKEMYDKIKAFIKHCWSYFKRKILKIEKEKIIIEG